jgi:hypothetical protein
LLRHVCGGWESKVARIGMGSGREHGANHASTSVSRGPMQRRESRELSFSKKGAEEVSGGASP